MILDPYTPLGWELFRQYSVIALFFFILFSFLECLAGHRVTKGYFYFLLVLYFLWGIVWPSVMIVILKS